MQVPGAMIQYGSEFGRMGVLPGSEIVASVSELHVSFSTHGGFTYGAGEPLHIIYGYFSGDE